MKIATKFWNLQNWLITHKLKYLALFMYLCVMVVAVPCMWVLMGIAHLLDACVADIIWWNIKQICKGRTL